MTHETRIALLVGLVFIVLFGLVLGQRSISFSKSHHSSQSAMPGVSASSPPGPEVVSAVFCERSNRPVLAPSEQERVVPDVSAASAPPAAPDTQPVPVVRVISPPSLRTYRVRSGDTLIGIARKVYGRRCEGEHLRIYRANRDKLSSPEALSVGQVLVIPPPPADASRPRHVASTTLRSSASLRSTRKPPHQRHYTEMTLTALSSRFNNDRTYVVRSGDCLTDIARREIGSGSRSAVRKLLDANRGRIADPNRLMVGMRLKIPG